MMRSPVVLALKFTLAVWRINLSLQCNCAEISLLRYGDVGRDRV